MPRRGPRDGASATAAPGLYAIDAALSDMGTGKLARDYDVSIFGGSLSVFKDKTTTRLSDSAGTSNFGQSVTFTATVAATAPVGGTATGTVSFHDGPTLLGTRTLSGGAASITVINLPAATHRITASFSGDGKFGASASVALTEAVLSAAQQAQLLVIQVNALVTNKVMSRAAGTELTTTLAMAIANFGAGTDSVGLLSLKSFIADLGALVRKGNLSSNRAQPLIAQANQAMASAQATGEVATS